MYKRLSTLAICFLLLPLQACNANTDVPPESSTSIENYSNPSSTNDQATTLCTIPQGAFAMLPELVLSATDITSIDSYVPATESFGTFSSETGGAQVDIEINNLHGTPSLNRSYTEPGLTPDTREYQITCIRDGIIIGEQVRGKFVKEGLLWLELDSENEFITPDLWILLEKD